MTFWNPDNIRAACGGTWLVRPAQIELPRDRPADLPRPDLYAPITGVCTDTRTIAKGQAFIALRGENFDGHKFVADAVRGGAPIVIVDDLAAAPSGGIGLHGNGWGGCGVMKVAETGKALLRIAAAYRESLKRTKVIAVCGSNGKTTTTRLIDHLLGHGGGAGNMRGTASRKSFNNAVGVPLTILSAKENDQYLICEVGTNHPGEIAILGDVVRPDIAVITSIGREHLEGLGSLAGVAKEEAAIVKYVKGGGAGGWVVATDAPEIAEYLRPIKNQVTFGKSKAASLRLTAAKHEVADGRAWLSFTINGRQHGRLPLVGEHNALNAIAALAVARRMGVDEQKSLRALETAGGADMRLETVRVDGKTILNDAYNANPDSMLAGIDTLLALRSAGFGESGFGESVGGSGGGRAVCVLGEMLELGEASAACHRSVAQALVERAKSGGAVDLVVLVGAGMKHAASALAEEGWPADRVRHFESADGPNAAEIAGLLVPGDLVLVKGSRRVRLERVVAALKEGSGGPAVAVRAPGQVEGKTGTLAGVEGRLG